LDFKNPKIISSKEIFTEKQLREYTATYSVDERFDVVKFFLGLFNKNNNDNQESAPVKTPAAVNTNANIASSLKSTVSVQVLQEKTAQFVQGKIDAKGFYTILTAAFGNKLPQVLPEIISSLPGDKAAALSKVAAK
jgi:hypothetical protein